MSKLGLRERIVLGANKAASYIHTHPYRGIPVLGTGICMALSAMLCYPTKSDDDNYQRNINAATDYAAALPKGNDTIETVMARMQNVTAKHGYRAEPRYSNRKVDCTKYLVPDAPLVFKGNELSSPVNPQRYFNCLSNNRPGQYLQAPQKDFNKMVFVASPLIGITMGGVFALMIGAAKKSRPQSRTLRGPTAG